MPPNKNTTHLSIARGWVVATSYKTKVYFAGGLARGNQLVNVIDIFDTATLWWDSATLSVPRETIWAVTIGSYVIFGTGYPGNTNVDVHNADTDTWSVIQAPTSRLNAAAITIGSKVVAFGGHDANQNFLTSANIYDLNTHTWETIENLQTELFVNGVSNGKIGVFAGGYGSRGWCKTGYIVTP